MLQLNAARIGPGEDLSERYSLSGLMKPERSPGRIHN